LLTDNEKKVINNLVEAWNHFLNLPIEHGDDIQEFKHHIHILQRQIMCRPVRRNMNNE
jgi:hypothetical protein